MALKIYRNIVKRLKLKVKKFLGHIPAFREVTRENFFESIFSQMDVIIKQHNVLLDGSQSLRNKTVFDARYKGKLLLVCEKKKLSLMSDKMLKSARLFHCWMKLIM